MFSTRIQLGNRTIGPDQPLFLIAEMACAHDGDLKKAKALVEAAARAGVDAIQLQLFSTGHQMAPHHRLYDLLRNLELSAGQWKALFAHAVQYEMAIFAFTYDLPSIKLAIELGIDGIKLSSADLSNPEMLEAAARSHLPITLGTGASTLDEIGNALRTIERAGGRQVVLMHGVQNFPTALEDANIRRIRLLQRTFQLPVGYQDHTDASKDLAQVIDLVALGMGACIIEKHVTLDRSEKGTDYQAALQPAELIRFVERLKAASMALGTDRPQAFTESDERYRQFQKKGIVAACTLAAGEEISRDKVLFLRSDTTPGLAPQYMARILGKRTRRRIEQFEQIHLIDMED